MSDRWPYIRYGNPDATPADKIRQLMAELNTQIIAESARMFGLGAAQDDARIAEAERRGYLKGREEAVEACEEDARHFASPEYATGQPLSSLAGRTACQTCATAIRALEPPKGGDAT